MSFSINNNAVCAVIGYGSWATALVKILLENEKMVAWHIANSEVAESVIENSYNHKYLSSVTFDTTSLHVSSDINEVVSMADIVILATPSSYLISTLEPLTASLEDKFVISAIKGIIPDGLLTIAEYINQKYNLSFKQIGVITGPCHAEEVALGRLSYLNIVTTDTENSELLASKFRGRYIKINLLKDIYGTEYSAVMKNIYAIAVGIAIGVGYGDNFISVLIANAHAEIDKFLHESYPFERGINSSPYLGDLLVTCYSQFSRNRTFGLMIGKGYSVKSAQIEMSMIAEGYRATDCIKQICSAKSIELPIIDAVYAILYKRASARNELSKLTNKLI
ncbi:MAG: NAD(P)H-dependent glycerol-3-phosphate dehydrogenase [Rikenellaceae bacterium]